MAKLMTSPDESQFAIVDLTALEYETVYRALHTAGQHAIKVGASADQNDIQRLLNALDDSSPRPTSPAQRAGRERR